MKFKVTKKEMRQSGRDILKIGYCNAQFLLRGFDPVAYSERREGWACDYYDIIGVTIPATMRIRRQRLKACFLK